MSVYVNSYENETIQEVAVIDRALGIGETDCIECEGSGWWDYGPPGTDDYCVPCKGTGKIYVSI